MRLLEKTFTKNGLTYETLSRTDNVGLFELWMDEEWLHKPSLVGFEVGIIYKNESWEIAGNKVEASESIIANDGFGYDGSKAFFPHDRHLAWRWFYELNLIKGEKKALRLVNSLSPKGKTATISKK